VLRALTTVVILLETVAHAGDLTRELAQSMRGRSGTAVVADVASGHVLACTILTSPPVVWRAPDRQLSHSRCLRSCSPATCVQRIRWPVSATFMSALAYSCNTFFATFGLRLTSAELTDAFTRPGFASPSGFAPDEVTGFIHPARTDEERQLQAVGEGEMEVTPLEMLAAYRNLALRRTASDASDAERTAFHGLEEATDYGLVRLAAVPGIKVAGKTGTPRAGEGAWTNAWFAGYAPAEKLLKTDSGTLAVHVGPSAYIARQQFTFAKGDPVEVVGSKVSMAGKDMLLAREITKDGKTLVVRNAQGVPKWAGGRHGSN
jgi:hypothetical protein